MKMPKACPLLASAFNAEVRHVAVDEVVEQNMPVFGYCARIDDECGCQETMQAL